MRPTQLTMTAFGPYRGSETIDFNLLKEYGLFAVSGATGAGKTTIFDAICFALYGQASGEDRTDIRALRSDFADSALQTAVELEFVIQHRTFRIFRQVPYIKKGNKSETSGRVEFFEVTSEGEIPAVDRQIVTEVNQRIEELIGFTLAQFSQIVMLPQGEFRKFLTSDTENKETILRKIFKTERYREMADILKRKKDQAERELAASQLEMQQIYRQLPSSFAVRESRLFTELQAESIHSLRLMEALKEEELYYKALAQQLDEQYETIYQAHELAQQVFHEAKSDNQKFEELKQRYIKQKNLASQADEMSQNRSVLNKSLQAVQLEGIDSLLREAKASVIHQQEKLDQSQTVLGEALQSAKSAEQAFHEEEQKKPLRDKCAKQLITLQNFLPSVTQIEEQEQQIRKISKRVETGITERDTMKADETAKTEKSQQMIEQLHVLETAVEGYEELVDSLAEARREEELRTRLSTHTKTISQLEYELAEKRQSMEQAQKHVEAAEAGWLANQASQLAETLEEGAPCPVCGSAHHPAVQSSSKPASITKEQVEQEKLHAHKASEAYYTTASRLESERNDAMRLEEQLEGADPAMLDETKRTVQSLEHQLKQMKSKRDQLPLVKKQAADAEEQLSEHRRSFNEQEKAVYIASAELKEARSNLAVSIKTVPERYHSLQTLHEEIKHKEKNKKALESMWEEARQKQQAAKEAVSSAQTAAAYITKSLKEAEEKERTASFEFAEALRGSIFKDEADYRESKLLAAERDRLQAAIQDYDLACQLTKQAIEELEKQLEGKQEANLTELLERTELLKKQCDQAYTERHAALEQERKAGEFHEQLDRLTAAQGGLEQAYGRFAQLYDLVRGTNERKLSFERYLQTEYLERILQAANGRLSDLSNGQFQLLRSDRQESRGRQSGLGIDVYDEYTGQNRDVKTLSGGEKFNASLSLALGMADVIQSFQGSISIDTMFIDEGFGSLDEESLQKAIETLIGLQKAGRMIGVISHVAELKEAFPAVLRVEKTKEGHSYTRIEIR